MRPNVPGAVTVDWKPSGSAGSPAGLTTGQTQNISAYAAGLGLSQPLLGNLGGMGRNVLRLNGERNFDWNLYKNFFLHERLRLQYRAEFYNIFNNTSFQEVNANISNPSFGQYTSVSQNSRTIQMGLRLVF